MKLLKTLHEEFTDCSSIEHSRRQSASHPEHRRQREPEWVTDGAGEGLAFLKVVTGRTLIGVL